LLEAGDYPKFEKNNTMKLLKSILLIAIAFSFSNGSNASTGPDDVLGIWLNATGKGQIQIFKQGNAYFGKLVWLKEPNDESGKPKTDKNNPDANLKSKPIWGLQILKGFQFDKDEWNGGKIYDPQNGKEYKCYMKMKDANTLLVRGYIGIAMVGRTETWTRIK
jgi:uncharacterized protein (DUF2147 family)